MKKLGTEESGCWMSDTEDQRFLLWRTWDSAPPMLFIGLNPSTADHRVDDPTIRRCTGFARREGCGGLLMANLFALRATDPADLYASLSPTRRDWLRAGHSPMWDPGGALQSARVTVAAWGAMAGAPASLRPLLRAQVLDVMTHFPALVCLGVTRDGAPRHPLYVKADQPLLPFSPPSHVQQEGLP